MTDDIVSMGVSWWEAILRRTQHSFYNEASAYMPIWPVQPLEGAITGFNITSIEHVIKGLGGTMTTSTDLTGSAWSTS
ncbi:hypothetical protein [Actinomadura nitritigenes]|uniref:Uncharacterized protein n=1 Tax=Actinomadura nitritigenes TaxID=134602 RepID=A0ABS3RCC3_9ACTN|nr:hypothetical protein [Actinomadura nitritigenes]MBO2443875.1 hypothetical protein [Actinomadura nitritigenes]